MTESDTHDQKAKAKYIALEQIGRGLSQGEFLLYYQPKVNMRTGEVVGAEALIRWRHPDQGLLLPAAFLPAVDDHLMSVTLGNWVSVSPLIWTPMRFGSFRLDCNSHRLDRSAHRVR